MQFYSFLCKLSKKLEETDDELAALEAATAVQTAKDVVWRQPEYDLMPLEEGHVYHHLHGLVRDPDWWKPYIGVK